MTSIIMMKGIVMPTMTIDLSKAASAPLNPTNIHECLQLPVPPHITLTYIYTIYNVRFTNTKVQLCNCESTNNSLNCPFLNATLENTMLESILKWWSTIGGEPDPRYYLLCKIIERLCSCWSSLSKNGKSTFLYPSTVSFASHCKASVYIHVYI